MNAYWMELCSIVGPFIVGLIILAIPEVADMMKKARN